jgi:hypothetical protein
MKFNFLTLLAASLLCSLTVLAAPKKLDIKFEDARIFAPLKGSNATAGYVNIKNDGTEEVTLILKKVEGFKAVETHETLEESGQMMMKKVESFKIAAGSTLELKPGGRHLMLFDPEKTMKEGSRLKVTFSVNGKDETISFKVIARTPSEHAHH